MPYARRNPPARYTLPDVVNPATHKCFVVRVPNEKFHLAAFRGQLEALAHAYVWDNDAAHTALDVAKVWRGVLDNMENCMPEVQFRQADACTLQASFDGGLTWATIFNAYNCALGAVQDRINDGTIGRTQQPPPGGTIPTQECKTYHITLNGNDRWHCPVAVSAGYSITITNAAGGWSDGYALGAYWQCPSGDYYTLGYCVEPPIAGYPDDPMPAQPHMRLVGHAGDWFDAYNTVYTVPNGVSNSEFFLQANDSNLGDNLGSIALDVTVCNYSEWCYEWDFTLTDGGWQPLAGTGAVWAAGSGWTGSGIYADQVYIARTFEVANLTEVSFWRSGTPACGNPNIPGYICYNPDLACGAVYSGPCAAMPNPVVLSAIGNNVTAISLGTESSGPEVAQWGYITKVRVRGTGGNPFGASNC